MEVDEEGESEIRGLEHITDIYLPEIQDEYIKNDLISRITFDNCSNMEIIAVE